MVHIVQAPTVSAAPAKYHQPMCGRVVGRTVPITRHGRVARGLLRGAGDRVFREGGLFSGVLELKKNPKIPRTGALLYCSQVAVYQASTPG